MRRNLIRTSIAAAAIAPAIALGSGVAAADAANKPDPVPVIPVMNRTGNPFGDALVTVYCTNAFGWIPIVGPLIFVPLCVV
ncbi:hypothetical protein [Nocardia cyriacigeorgica]|uniref:Secreted protein n=1 Tax=Nocardia cyriacigeorgica TaxID=135487 RepID=A0A6P1D396_9NOCA|nr:hypothetical protein [Nocardia cyriacigeorgica]NEW44937.1 hypothetical protein [Nocardia cyriacigeorgica]